MGNYTYRLSRFRMLMGCSWDVDLYTQHPFELGSANTGSGGRPNVKVNGGDVFPGRSNVKSEKWSPILSGVRVQLQAPRELPWHSNLRLTTPLVPDTRILNRHYVHVPRIGVVWREEAESSVRRVMSERTEVIINRGAGWHPPPLILLYRGMRKRSPR